MVGRAHLADYTTWLNIAFLVLPAVLRVRFVVSGGRPMLRMMGGTPDDAGHHDHTAHADQQHAGHEPAEHHSATDPAHRDEQCR